MSGSWTTHYTDDRPIGDLAFVIRCKDCCKRGSPFCLAYGMNTDDDDFCSYADVLDDRTDIGRKAGESMQ